MNRWSFGIDNDYLVGLVLEGKKRATTSNYDFETFKLIKDLTKSKAKR